VTAATISPAQPADLLYGRLLATAAQHVLGGGPPPLARVRWIDGNVGIGGSPAVLLRRTRELLAAGGSALVELDPPGAPTVRTRIRLEAPGAVSEWFAWARVGIDGIGPLAAAAGLTHADTLAVGGRWIAVLLRP
jgi:hypothetical protein